MGDGAAGARGGMVTADEARRLLRRGNNKYGAKAVVIDGIRFDSLAEGRRYNELKLEVAAGEITALECHPRFPLVVNGVKVGTYVADFAYVVLVDGGPRVVEDVKSRPTRTQSYRLKRKLMLALYGIAVREVTS
ncbi:MAG TPA: DUF1064 domain-containing protein [Gemmatimonadaceae bacterium]